jgi:salicylate hydroxylase
MSRANKIRFHLPDGPAQEARDAEWARAGDRSPEALRWLFEFDADVSERRSHDYAHPHA